MVQAISNTAALSMYASTYAIVLRLSLCVPQFQYFLLRRLQKWLLMPLASAFPGCIVTGFSPLHSSAQRRGYSIFTHSPLLTCERAQKLLDPVCSPLIPSSQFSFYALPIRIGVTASELIVSACCFRYRVRRLRIRWVSCPPS